MSPPASNPLEMPFRKLTVAALAVTLLSACGNDSLFNASAPTIADTYTIFALTGTPPAYPSALDTYFRQPVRVDGSGAFDVAFDLDPSGRIVIYPVKLVVRSLNGDRRIGLMKVAESFALVTSAPKGTYQTDSAVVVSPGEVVVIEAQRNRGSDACQFALSPNIYTKLVVDSVAIATRTITVRTVMDPNCGFRSFEEGIPGN
jgi:hypothetical protein